MRLEEAEAIIAAENRRLDEEDRARALSLADAIATALGSGIVGVAVLPTARFYLKEWHGAE